ncbi:hypothetical protein STXM2123_2383 [Streptomyces sp. F-3]|nr:hypothetical protein STXM2123_2383 [Streptomyces sp. F-3]
MRTGRAGLGVRTAAHHPCDRMRLGFVRSCPLSTFNSYG